MNDAQIDIFIQQNANTTDTGLIGLYFVWQPEFRNPFQLWQVDEGLERFSYYSIKHEMLAETPEQVVANATLSETVASTRSRWKMDKVFEEYVDHL